MDPMQAAALFTAFFAHRDPVATRATSHRAAHPRRRPRVSRLRTRRHPPE